MSRAHIGTINGVPISSEERLSDGGAEIAADLMASDEDEDLLDGIFDE